MDEKRPRRGRKRKDPKDKTTSSKTSTGKRRQAAAERAEKPAAKQPDPVSEIDSGATFTLQEPAPARPAPTPPASARPAPKPPVSARPAPKPPAPARPAPQPPAPAKAPAEALASTETAVAVEEPPIAKTAMLEVEELTKSYGGRTVVNGVSFTVQSGEVIGLLGKNGAGKTTTFRMTIGMIAPEKGCIRFVGQDVTVLPMYRRARLGMGYLSQEPSVFRGLTVEQNLNAILELTPLSSRDRVRRRDELVEEFGLGRLLHSKAAVLSGGEKRRLEIARALITEPSLILLDEPFSGVDPIAVEDIRQIILRLRDRGIGILLTDHNVRETLNTTNRSFIILDGRIIAQGSRDAILNDPNARKHYLGERFQM